MTLLLILALNCPETKLINRSNLDWTEFDKYEISYAKKRCGEIDKDYPCLLEFYKLHFQDYYANCGMERK